MNRAFYIVGIVFSVIFLFVCGYYASEVSAARISELFSSYSYDSYYSYSSYAGSGAASDLTEEAGFISLLFILVFITVDLLGLIKVKTKTMKVMGIIGLSISAIFLFWDFAVIGSPGSLSFDEVGGAFVLYSFIMLAFGIVGLVQSVRFAKAQKAGGVIRKEESRDILDS